MASASQTEWAWAAGLFEGEGCISMTGRAGGKHQPVLQLTMTDRDTVKRFHRVVGVGNFTGPQKVQRERHRPTWRWQAGAWRDVAHVLIRFAPWLSERRRSKGAEVMRKRPLDSWLPDYTKRLQTHCRNGHALTGDNVGAQNKCKRCERERRKRWLQTPAGKAWRARQRDRERATT